MGQRLIFGKPRKTIAVVSPIVCCSSTYGQILSKLKCQGFHFVDWLLASLSHDIQADFFRFF